jgi:glycosyltransferase involved in cell wall biosynthesis
VVEPDLRGLTPRGAPGRAPLASILLPVHDAADTLAVSLRSIQRQSETRWHCVAVDDGSRDTSAEILAAFAASDPRFEVLREPHRGIVGALTAGLSSCRAPVVFRMDADDWMHSDRVAAQLALLSERPELCGVGARVRMFPRAGLSDGRRAYEGWLNAIGDAASLRREAYVECPIAHPTLAIRRQVLCDYGYRDEGWPEDYDLILRLLADGRALSVHPRRLLGWRDSPARASRRLEQYGLDRFVACKAAHLADTFLAGSPHYILWGYGDTGRVLRRALLAHDREPAYIVELHPRRLGQRIHGAEVVPPTQLPGLPRLPIVASVSGSGPRQKIRRALADMGFRELRDYVCAA